MDRPGLLFAWLHLDDHLHDLPVGVPDNGLLTRFRVGADVLAETAGGMVMQLDERPPGEDGADVTVILAPTISSRPQPPLTLNYTARLKKERDGARGENAAWM